MPTFRIIVKDLVYKAVVVDAETHEEAQEQVERASDDEFNWDKSLDGSEWAIETVEEIERMEN